MKKKYELPEENPEHNEVSEPAIEYSYRREADMVCSPPLTDEELQSALTTDEVIKIWCNYIDEKTNQ